MFAKQTIETTCADVCKLGVTYRNPNLTSGLAAASNNNWWYSVDVGYAIENASAYNNSVMTYLPKHTKNFRAFE